VQHLDSARVRDGQFVRQAPGAIGGLMR
jgi:hypothetical protein